MENAMTGTDLVHRFYAAVSAQRDEDVKTLLTEDFEVHNGRADDGTRGPAAVLNTIEALRAGLDDLSFTVDDTIEQGDRVAARWTMHGTHTRALFGKPATGNQITQRGMVFYRTENNRLAELWPLVDVFGLFQQIS
jgi:steroid delta-isomerase-like uncharacterized protein